MVIGDAMMASELVKTKMAKVLLKPTRQRRAASAIVIGDALMVSELVKKR